MMKGAALRSRALHSRAVLESLPDSDRGARLRELEAAIARRVSAATTPEAFLRECRLVVDELRALGHDLWSWDNDGENETWGGDYMHPETAGRLLVMFEFRGTTRVAWWNGLSGNG